MGSRILRLFDDEKPPEEMKAVGKSRARPKATGTKKKASATAAAGSGEKRSSKSAKTSRKTPVLQGWKPDKQYFSIGEVSDLFEVNTSHIRFWTNEFELKVRTTKKGDRLYTPDQIRELKVIYDLVKERGYTLQGAKAKLKSDKNVTVDSVDLKQSLLHLRNKLQVLRNQLV